MVKALLDRLSTQAMILPVYPESMIPMELLSRSGDLEPVLDLGTSMYPTY